MITDIETAVFFNPKNILDRWKKYYFVDEYGAEMEISETDYNYIDFLFSHEGNFPYCYHMAEYLEEIENKYK